MIIVSQNGNKIDFRYELVKLENNNYQIIIKTTDEDIPKDSTLNILFSNAYTESA